MTGIMQNDQNRDPQPPRHETNINDYYLQYLQLINNCDPDDKLLSQTPLGQQLDQIPLDQINPSDLIQLNQALNLEQLIRTKVGLARDYRGLAELMDFSSLDIETRFKRSYNPTKSLIDSFINKNLMLINNKNSQTSRRHHHHQSSLLFTVNDLLKMIERLERFDVIDDFLPILIKLATHQKHLEARRPKDNEMISNYHDDDDDHHHHQLNLVSETLDKRLTIDDTGGYKIVYDAFICFAPEDMHYAHDLIRLLEHHNKRLATADDLLPGHFEHDGLVQLIDSRCRKVIIILTPNFLRSKECEFQLKFASEVAIRANVGPKIIPVLYEACDDLSLPYMIRVVSKIDMTSHQARQWQLRKLISSLDHDNSPPAANLADLSQRRALFGQSSSSSSSSMMASSSPPIVELASSAINSSSVIAVDPIRDYRHLSTSSPQHSPPPSLKLTPPPLDPLACRPMAVVVTPTSASINWFKNVKRKLIGPQQNQALHDEATSASSARNSPSPSTSSRAMLLTSDSAEFLPNGTGG